MIAGECVQKEPRELVPDRLPESKGSGRLHLFEALHASAMLEDQARGAGLRLGGVHAPNIGDRRARKNPSPE